MRVNGLPKSGTNSCWHEVFFTVHFCYVSNAFLIERPSRLRDALTLAVFLYKYVLPPCKSQLVTHPTSPQMYLDFHFLCCCATNATSSWSSTCTCDQESRPTKPSSSAIPHRERAKKIFLEAFYVTARSLLQIPHHGLSISSPGAHRPLLSATRCRPDWAVSFQIYSCWRRGIILHSFFSNHVFHTEYDDLDKYYFAKQFIKIFNLHYYDRFI
jgi:hypothetical protein